MLHWGCRKSNHSTPLGSAIRCVIGPTGASAPIDVAHKTVVLRCLEAICDNGQLLVDIFVNYDCDLEGANLFERLVNALVRIAQGNQDKEAQASVQPDEQRLRINVRFPLAAFLFCSMIWQVCPCLSAYNAEPVHQYNSFHAFSTCVRLI